MKRILMLSFLMVMLAFPKAGEDEIVNYLDNLKVGEPVRYKNLTIFPLLAKRIFSLHDYITLDQAIDKGWLKIREAGSGEVNFVEVKNNGPEPVFIMTGEMITGARQDRMLKEDLLLPTQSGWIRVPVFCVEHGRWTEVSHEFKSGGLLVPNTVREKAKMTESQTEVWDEIAASQDRLGISAGTGTVNANYEDEEVKKALAEYTDKFIKIPKLSKATIGVVVVTGNQIIGFDMFANNSLLDKLWPKLIKSYCIDAISGRPGEIYKDDIEELIEALKDAKFVSTGTLGFGKLIKIESELGQGSALVHKTAVVHMDFFPGDDITYHDSKLRLDFRRDQRLNN